MNLHALRHYMSESCGSLVSDAFRISIDLARRGFSSWCGDLLSLLNGLELPVPVACPIGIDWIILPDNISLVESSVRLAVARRIFNDVLQCPRVPLLHTRARRLLHSNSFSTDGASISKTQGYVVALNSPTGRKSLFRILLAEHGLRCEMGRREGPGASRHCRLCGSTSESEIHALFFCQGSPALRDVRAWLEDIRRREFPTMASHLGIGDDTAAFLLLDNWLANDSNDARRFRPLVAKLARTVLSCYEHPVLL